MSATIEPFPANPRSQARGTELALRYVGRAEEAFQQLDQAGSGLERAALCRIAEIWLDLAESALPTRP